MFPHLEKSAPQAPTPRQTPWCQSATASPSMPWNSRNPATLLYKSISQQGATQTGAVFKRRRGSGLGQDALMSNIGQAATAGQVTAAAAPAPGVIPRALGLGAVGLAL